MILIQFLLCLGVVYSLSFTDESNATPQDVNSLLQKGFQFIDEGESSLAMPGGRRLQEGCKFDRHGFQIQVVLDLYGNPHLLSQEEKDLMGKTIMKVYNEQVYCPGNNFRQIHAVNDIATSFVDQGERDFSLSFIVSGSCKGCNSNTTLFEYSDLKQSDDCPCRGPSPLSFNVFFSSYFYQWVGERSLTSVTELHLVSEVADTPECPDYSTFTSSDVIVQLYGCPLTMSESDFDSIATVFIQTYNRINGINAKLCDRFFRRILSARVILPPDGFVSQSVRNLKSRNKIRFIEGQRDLANDDDEFQCPGYFEIRLDITAQCRGCDVSKASLFDKEMDVNFFESYDDDYFPFDSNSSNTDDSIGNETMPDDDLSNNENETVSDDSIHYHDDDHDDDFEWRHLVEVSRNMEVSTCQCPLNPLFRAVTEEELTTAYHQALSPLSFELECWGLVEVKKVTCTPTVQDFQTEVEITVESIGPLSQASVNLLKEDFMQSYNMLIQRYCDPYFRDIQDAEVASNESRRVRARSLQKKPPIKKVSKYKVVVVGHCRGCPSKSNLFVNDAIKRRQLQASSNSISILAHKDVNLRRLQTGDQCLCAIDKVANSPPTIREFLETFSPDIGKNVVIKMVQETDGGDVGELATRKECDVNADCVSINKGSLCVNFQCLHEGNPRVTLTWEGDDDLDLVVHTPEGTVIDFSTDFDHVTGGTFDTLYSQDDYGSHVESIFFPISGGPSGNYRIEIVVYEQRGLPDNWSLEVVTDKEDGAQAFLTDSGIGPRNDITFYVGDSESIDSGDCSTEDLYVECCEDVDCGASEQFTKRCVNSQCITEAARRFTLTWFGNDDYDLVVVSPNSERISTFHNFDSDSGGVFEDDQNEKEQDQTFHTESVYFPSNYPFGEYLFFVETYTQNGFSDDWKIEVAELGEIVNVETGAGTSSIFSYVALECKVNTDCTENQICLNDHCMKEGTVRFTLTWEGYDDLDISVKTPQGNVISWENPNDDVSSGFREDDFDYTSWKHAESVVFGANGVLAPFGMYQVYVDVYNQDGDIPNKWRLSVNVKGKEVKAWSKTGAASVKWGYRKNIVY